MIKLGCCAFLSGPRSVEDGLRLVADLGFRYADVSAADIGEKAQVDQQEAAARPQELGRLARQAADRHELALEELFICPVFVDGQRVEVNSPDATLRTRVLDQFTRICAYAAEAGFKSVMGVPGTPQQGNSPQQNWDYSVEMLTRMVAIARQQGVRLNVEPHVGSIIQDPRLAVKLAQDAPGLTYTLDYSHFISLGYKEADVFPLHAYAAHMHARQARPGAGGCVVAEGTIDFPAIVKQLQAANWDGVIAMEYFAGRVLPLRNSGALQNLVLAYQLDQLIERGVV
jgi:sugar phosphate isomerase/epimerase